MKAPVINIFKKQLEAANKPGAGDHGLRPKPATPASTPASRNLLLKAMPSWWVVFFAYALVAIFCWTVHRFFLWFSPYLQEVFTNLKGLPTAWADLGLFWAERGLAVVAIVAAIYHNLWQIGTRYKFSPRDLTVESWFPVHHVVSAPYGAVRRVGFRQSVLGILFNYGHLEIDTGSPAGPLVFLNCPKPRKFISFLQSKVEAVLQPGLAHHRRASDSHAHPQ